MSDVAPAHDTLVADAGLRAAASAEGKRRRWQVGSSGWASTASLSALMKSASASRAGRIMTGADSLRWRYPLSASGSPMVSLSERGYAKVERAEKAKPQERRGRRRRGQS
jgi:hypothetical protein